MKRFAKPIVVASSCLEYEKVRYNGALVESRFIRDLAPFVTFKRICPEVGIGLGIPRDPIRIVRKEGKDRLVQPSTGRDLTDTMNSFADEYIAALGKDVDGFIFKSKSPTMGVRRIKVYAGEEKAPVVDTCNGFFAGAIIRAYDGYPIEEDDRLRNRRIRDYYLTRLFLLAAYREQVQDQEVETFIKDNSLLLRLYGGDLYTSLEETDPISGEFESLLRRIMHSPLTVGSIAEFYQEAAVLTPHPEEFSSRIDDFIENRITRETLREILRTELQDTPWAEQSIFRPYPAPLFEGAETDHEKDYWK